MKEKRMSAAELAYSIIRKNLINHPNDSNTIISIFCLNEVNYLQKKEIIDNETMMDDCLSYWNCVVEYINRFIIKI